MAFRPLFCLLLSGRLIQVSLYDHALYLIMTKSLAPHIVCLKSMSMSCTMTMQGLTVTAINAAEKQLTIHLCQSDWGVK